MRKKKLKQTLFEFNFDLFKNKCTTCGKPISDDRTLCARCGKRRRLIRAPSKILYGLRFKNRCVNCNKSIYPDRIMCKECSKNKKRPFHPYEESILRALNSSRKQLTPTQVAEIIGIHSVTAKKKMLLLAKKRLLLLKKRGNRNYFKINRSRF